MVMQHKLKVAAAIFAVILCGCSASNRHAAASVAATESTQALTREERIERARTREPKQLERVAVEESQPVTGEVPGDLLDRIMGDLEQRAGAARSDFTIERAESIQWPDGSLGCPEPGQEYTQALVDGYWIVIAHDGHRYDYRASHRGYFRLCPHPGSRLK